VPRDGAFYKDRQVLVIGGGNSGFEEGLFLTRFARQVTLLVRVLQPKASQVLRDKVARHAAMEVPLGHEVEAFAIGPDGRLEGVRVRQVAPGTTTTLKADGVFVFVGMTPNTEFLSPVFERDGRGFLLTGPTLQTSVPGVLAAGDTRAGATAQAASAAGEGATAALMIRQYLQSR
jgi:thioredoxin reductase (NADPH)